MTLEPAKPDRPEVRKALENLEAEYWAAMDDLHKTGDLCATLQVQADQAQRALDRAKAELPPARARLDLIARRVYDLRKVLFG